MRLGWIGAFALYIALAAAGCATQAAKSSAELEAEPPPAELKTALELERERSTGLKLALNESSQEIERLSRELARLRERETVATSRLKEVLRNRARRAEVGPQTAAPASEEAKAQIAALKQELASEQRRRAELETRLARLQAASERAAVPQASSEVDALKTELAKEQKHRLELETEISRLRAEMERREQAADPEIGALKEQLAKEQKRRTELEDRLARLQDETSTPPFESRGESQEMSRLRKELAEERAERTHLLSKFRDLQSREARATQGGSSETTSAETRALRARLIELESRQQEVMISLARTLAADRKREQELNRLLADARSQAKEAGVQQAAATTVPTVAVDGTGGTRSGRLEQLLDEERHRNARLAAKLKLAGRVTDLIFRMRQQAAQAPPPPAAP